MMAFWSILLTAFLGLDMVEAQGPFKLAPPLLKASSVFYTESATVTLSFAHPGAHVRYSFVNPLPSSGDSVYTTPLVITGQMATLYARSFATGYEPSDAATITLIKDGLPVSSINASMPHSRYPGSGPATLFDNRGGDASIASPEWMGYDLDSIDLWVSLQNQQTVKQVMLHFLQNEDSWVFLPSQVVIYGITRGGPVELGSLVNTTEVSHPGSRCVPQYLSLHAHEPLDQLHLVIKGIKQLPVWHSGKGQHAWVFIDEIKIY